MICLHSFLSGGAVWSQLHTIQIQIRFIDKGQKTVLGLIDVHKLENNKILIKTNLQNIYKATE